MTEPAEGSAAVAARVAAARDRQIARQRRSNARLDRRTWPVRLGRSPRRWHCSSERCAGSRCRRARYHRVLRVARTIADLADCERVEAAHVAEAVSFRQLDRRSGGSALEIISA